MPTIRWAYIEGGFPPHHDRGQNHMDEKSLSQIRHDVRTPLNAVLGLAELLATLPEGRTLPAEQQRRMYDLLKSSAGDLHKRIERLFDILDRENR